MPWKRTLYECFWAKVKGDRIYCAKGYRLTDRSQDGSINIERLIRGAPLAMTVCQDCVDFESMGNPVPHEEKGWLTALEYH